MERSRYRVDVDVCRSDGQPVQVTGDSKSEVMKAARRVVIGHKVLHKDSCKAKIVRRPVLVGISYKD